MKKFLSFVLCLVMLFSLAACGQEKQPEENPGKDNENNVTQDRDFISDPEVPDNTNNNVQSETAFVKLKNNIIDRGIYYEKEKKYVCRFTSNMSEINSCQLTYYPSQNMISYDFELSEVETTVEIYSGNEFYVKVNYPENFSFYSAIMKKSEYHNSKDLEENNFVPFCDLDKDKCLELVAVATDKAFGVLSITLQKFDMTLSDLGFSSFDADYNKTEDKTQNNDAEPNKPNDTETKPNTSIGNQTKPNTSTNTQTKPNTSTNTQTKPNTSTSTENKPNTSTETQVKPETPNFEPLEYSGSGDKVITGVNLPVGEFVVKTDIKTDGHSSVKFYYNADNYTRLVNEIGNYSGTRLIKDGNVFAVSDGQFEISSKGDWHIKIEPLSGTITGNSISGKGDTVTGVFNGNGKRSVLKYKVITDGHTSIRLYKYNGKSYDYERLVNEIGNYEGEKTAKLESGEKYFFRIETDGDWSISWE